MTDPTSTDEARTHTGPNAPIFNSSADEFEDWTQQVELWRHSSSQKPEKLRAHLVLQQIHATVYAVMMKATMPKIQTTDGLDAMLDEMIRYELISHCY